MGLRDSRITVERACRQQDAMAFAGMAGGVIGILMGIHRDLIYDFFGDLVGMFMGIYQTS